MFKDLIRAKVNHGFSYSQYIDNTIIQIAKATVEELEGVDKNKFDTIKLNIQRMERIDKTYKISKELKAFLSLISAKQTWMIITEDWCGDSAQNVPFIAAMAKENNNIDLKLILRDSNPDIMDMYLTEGTRSIPILVVFDENWNELWRWGSRPKAAQELVIRCKNQGLQKPEYLKQLHLWYAHNKGKDLEAEITELVKKYV